MNESNIMETPNFIDIASLVFDPELQFRGKLNKSMVDQFAERMETEDDLMKFVPVEVYFDGKTRLLADGHHRIEAAKKRGHSKIWALIHRGTQKEALLAAVSVNARHGLPLTRAERRRAAEAVVKRCVDLSTRTIADLVGISHQTVIRIKGQLVQMDQLKPTKTTVGKDGRSRPAHQKPQSQGKKSSKAKPVSTACLPIADASDNVANEPPNNRPTQIGPAWKGVKAEQTHFNDVRFEPDPDDDFYDWLTEEEREQLRQDQKNCPAIKLVPPIRSYTIQRIPEHDPQYLVSCLFSLFKPLYRKKHIFALARKMIAQGEAAAIQELVATLQKELQPQ